MICSTLLFKMIRGLVEVAWYLPLNLLLCPLFWQYDMEYRSTSDPKKENLGQTNKNESNKRDGNWNQTGMIPLSLTYTSFSLK